MASRSLSVSPGRLSSAARWCSPMCAAGRPPAPIVQPYTRARTHEGHRRPTRRDAASLLPRRLASSPTAQEAAMLALSRPRSLSEIWAWHRICADYYRGSEALS